MAPNKRAWETRAIKSISGHDANGGNEFFYAVRDLIDPSWSTGPRATSIAYREEYYGDHSLSWFDVHTDHGTRVSVAERFVREVRCERE